MPTTDIEELREIHRAAAGIFTDRPRHRCALTYLRQRGIDSAGLGPQWVIGYAPPGWTRLTDALRERFSDQALLDAGVARMSSRGTLIDTFRHRVVFGVRDKDATICGFIGRDLSGDARAPKYLNTHHNLLFDKSELLFGLHEGTRELVEVQPVVVEGPLDVLAIAARQRASRHPNLLPVAPCGTSFTARQARGLALVTDCREIPVVVAMDSDAAGRAAALVVGEQLRKQGLDVRVASLPNGTDPAEYLADTGRNLDEFRADHALPLIAVHVEHAISQQRDRIRWIEGRVCALRIVASYLATYPVDHTSRQVGGLAATLDLDPSIVTLELADAYTTRTSLEPPRSRVAPEPAALGM